MPAVPPPPPPTTPSQAVVAPILQERLNTQRAERKAKLANYKVTAMHAAAAALDNTPSGAHKLPTREELDEMAGTESGEMDSVAAAVLDPSSSRDDSSSVVEDGFAALRAQRAQRKALMREHQRTSASTKIARERTTETFKEKVDTH